MGPPYMRADATSNRGTIDQTIWPLLAYYFAKYMIRDCCLLSQICTDATTDDPVMQYQVPESGAKKFFRLEVVAP